MGRAAKYFTHEERLKARRERDAANSKQPSVKQARSASNRRAYERRRLFSNANVTLPDFVRKTASYRQAFDNEAILRRFRVGPAVLHLSRLTVEEETLQALSNATHCDPPAILSLVDFEEEWDDVSAALYGYQVRLYVTQKEAELVRYRISSKLDFSNSLLRHYQTLLSTWHSLQNAVRRFTREGDILAEFLSRHNAHWTASQLVYAYEDLQAVAQGDNKFSALLSDRSYHLGQSYC